MALDAPGDGAPRPPRRGPAVRKLAAAHLGREEGGRLLLERRGLLRDAVRLQHGDDGLGGQVVEWAAVAEEAGVEGRLADALAAAHDLDVLLHARQRVVVDAAPVEQRLDGLERLRVDGVVEGGGDRHAPHGLRRALRLRVKGADVLDDVAEELDADGRGGAGRVDVQDAAAAAGRAGRLDGGLHDVAHGGPLHQQRARLHALADGEGVGGVLELVGAQGALAQGGDGRHQHEPRPAFAAAALEQG